MLGARKAVRPSFVLSGKRRGRILVVGQVGYPEWPAAWLLSSLICLFAKSYSKKGDGDNPRTCYGSLVREVAVSMAVYFIGEPQFAPAIVLAGTRRLGRHVTDLWSGLLNPPKPRRSRLASGP